MSLVGSYQLNHQWTTMTWTRRQALTHVIVKGRRRHARAVRAVHAPLLQVRAAHASTHCVDCRKRPPSSAARPISSGTAMSSVSPTTNWPPTSTTSKSPRPDTSYFILSVYCVRVFDGRPAARVCCAGDDSGLGCGLITMSC